MAFNIEGFGNFVSDKVKDVSDTMTKVSIEEIANKYKISSELLYVYLHEINYPMQEGLLRTTIDEENVHSQKVISLVDGFKEWKEKRDVKLKEEKAQREQETLQKRAELSRILVTSGFNFEGYRIVKYSGYISGDDAVEVSRGKAGLIFDTATNVPDALMDSLKTIRRNSLMELKEAAYNLGCNAVIGVDFDYITLDPETANFNGGTTYLPYVFGVTANGTAVKIEPIE